MALDAGEGGNGCSAGEEDMSSTVGFGLRSATGVAGWLSRAMVWDGRVCLCWCLCWVGVEVGQVRVSEDI